MFNLEKMKPTKILRKTAHSFFSPELLELTKKLLVVQSTRYFHPYYKCIHAFTVDRMRLPMRLYGKHRTCPLN